MNARVLFFTIIISCVSLHCPHNKTLFKAALMRIVNPTLLTLMLDSPLQNRRVSDVSNEFILNYNMWVLFPYHLKNMLSNFHIFQHNLQFFSIPVKENK